MDLFGLNRFFSGPEDGRPPPKRGPSRYFEVLYDHLGAILGANLLTCIGFLPLALGVSLGVALENLWLALLGGVLSTLLNREEPDLQIAIVHAETLPDGVLPALENALSAEVGDLNGDSRTG